ncbi:MAG: bifunctional enoyl-CoA hydratase/phosphate acetyltransferase [Solirubrobacteraceae bacterium]
MSSNADRGSDGPGPDGRSTAELTEARVLIENRTFDEIAIGESAALQRTLSRQDIELFAVMSGDVNPAHVDDEYARSDMFHKIIAHGMWGASLISTLLGTRLPGPGTIYLEQTLRFRHPVAVGDTITVSVTAATKDPDRKRISFDCLAVNQQGKTLIDGAANVIAPTEKVSRPRVALPQVQLHERGVLFARLLARARTVGPIRMAVVHPVDRDALLVALQAAQEGLIIPVLVGPEERIRAVAAAEELQIADLELVATDHSHAAADAAVRLARSGHVEALMGGRMHAHELISTVLANRAGLRTDRRMSHVFVTDVPNHGRPLLITDAVLNVKPDLAQKRDIVQNAIDLALAIGVELPKVAILSAVETINPRVSSSLDAAALAKMAERGQIRGGIVDGPLAFDTAVAPGAARASGFDSPVSGVADILVVPDLETGNMLAKQLDHFAESQAAGIVLGAHVPIALTGLADSRVELVAACALATLIARVPGAAPGTPEGAAIDRLASSGFEPGPE